ncbi:MAG: tetraacyldisaccharide 4'-kinase [Steroidobacteraceae bacterium]
MPSQALARGLQAIWFGKARPPWVLRLLSPLFGLAVRARQAAFARGLWRSRRLPKPVVVVGNLTVGGSGKTPLVIWLACQLRERGFAPGIVLRGYGGSAASSDQPLAVEPGSDAAVVGDEALLLRERTGVPVVVGRDRVAAAERLLRSGVDLVIADDGLQHLRLARDFEIAVIDGARGLGNGYLLPAGPLREPPQRLATVNALVINGERIELSAGPQQAIFCMRLQGERLHTLTGADAQRPLSSLAGQRVHAVAGIGNPQRFFDHLTAAGVNVVPHAFPDHHRFRASDLEFDQPLPLLMTEKDAVKCRAFAAAERWCLPVTASFSGMDGSALLARLQRCLAL